MHIILLMVSYLQDHTAHHPVLPVPPSHTNPCSCIQQNQETPHLKVLYLPDNACMFSGKPLLHAIHHIKILLHFVVTSKW